MGEAAKVQMLLFDDGNCCCGQKGQIPQFAFL
jgi:hypothetical protein